MDHTISLATADRSRSLAFYRELGLEAPPCRRVVPARGPSNKDETAERYGSTVQAVCYHSGMTTCWVHDFKGQVAVFTGWLTVDGKPRTQAQCGALIVRKGGSWRDRPSAGVSLVVWGHLAARNLVDQERGYSEKLLFAYQQRQLRRQGSHVHVIDRAGFEDLLSGRPARCRRLRRSASGEVDVISEPYEDVFGALYSQPHQIPSVRSHQDLTVDLDVLDRATAAHERTVGDLARMLTAAGIDAFRPSHSAPQFDLGWRKGRRVHIAEVKSLTGAEQHQQVRLGLGQLLDYAWQLREGGAVVQPILVLERKPYQPRWASVTHSAGVILAYGPRFAALNL